MAVWPGSDRVWTALTAPPAVRARACTRAWAPAERGHTTTALPAEPTPTWGTVAFWPGSGRVWIALHAPPGVRARACTRSLAPSKRVHTTTASPAGPTPTWGLNAFWPAADRVWVPLSAPSPALRARAC